MADEKLIGTVRQELGQLNNDIQQINTMLSSLGSGVDQNLGNKLESQIKSIVDSAKKKIEELGSGNSGVANGVKKQFDDISSSITNVSKIIETTSSKGDVRQIVSGFDQLGNSIREVSKNGELQNSTITKDGAFAGQLREANELYKQQSNVIKELYEKKSTLARTDSNSADATNLRNRINLLEEEKRANADRIAQIDSVAAAQAKLPSLVDQEIAAQKKLGDTIDKVNSAKQDAAAKKAQENFINPPEQKQAEDALRRLTDAYTNYFQAKKLGDKDGMAYWSSVASASMQEINDINTRVSSLNIEESARSRINDAIQKASIAQEQFTAKTEQSSQAAQQLASHIDSFVKRMTTMAVRNLWSDATQYVSEYYDLMNQIQIVSGKSDAEIKKLGANYRKTAKEMSVNSTEIAEAAVEYWRQGLDTTQVDERLKATIEYAKISSLEFTEAAELMTSATNTFGEQAEHVADVWAVQGDESAAG